MDPFSYLSVLMSIIVGLAITQILTGYRGIVLSRRHVSIYWPTLVWSASLMLINVQSWWASFGLRAVQNWTFAGFMVVLMQAIFQYMIAGIVLPDFSGERRVDLREHYWGHIHWFFTLMILVLLTSLAKDFVLEGHLTDPANLAFHGSFIALCLLAQVIRREWYHRCLAVAVAVLLCVYIVVLFARLR